MSTKSSIVFLSVSLLSACNTIPILGIVDEVKPWQRGILAQPQMSLEPDSMDQFVDDHIYFSKEASSGGRGVGGGGCGCN